MYTTNISRSFVQLSSFTFFILCLLLVVGCPKDKEEPTPDLILPKNLLGTEWRCNQGAGFESSTKVYDALRFISTTEVEGWVLEKNKSNPEKLFVAKYEVKGKVIKVTDTGDVFTATLNDQNQLITNIDGNGQCTYIKQ